MGDDLILCMASCKSSNKSIIVVGNDSFDMECITQCTQRQGTLQEHTTEKYV